MHSVEVPLGPSSYEILIGRGLIEESGSILAEKLSGKKIALVSDSTVQKLHGDRLSTLLKDAGFEVHSFTIKPGESSKHFESVISLCRQFAESNLDRNSTVAAFGGGVVGDVAGFAAAIYLRGLPYVQIPTTLLADCDSAVGGKVGVNLDGVKNLIGSFYQPKVVIIDPEFLRTLPSRQLKSGLVEAVKTGLIGDADLYGMIFSNLEAILHLYDIELVCELIKRSVRVKARIVTQDEKEAGLRRILNFGHTIGHAIEGVLGGEAILHGEAVLLGMQAALWISYKKETLEEAVYDRISSDLNRIPIDADIRGISFKDIMGFIRKDKKNVDDHLHFILLEDVGKPYDTQTVEKQVIAEAFMNLQQSRL